MALLPKDENNKDVSEESIFNSIKFIEDSLSEEVTLRQMIDDWCIKQLGNTSKALEIADNMFSKARDVFYKEYKNYENKLK